MNWLSISQLVMNSYFHLHCCSFWGFISFSLLFIFLIVIISSISIIKFSLPQFPYFLDFTLPIIFHLSCWDKGVRDQLCDVWLPAGVKQHYKQKYFQSMFN